MNTHSDPSLSDLDDPSFAHLPYSDQTERAALASVLESPRDSKRMMAKLRPSMFYPPKHQALFHALAEVRHAGCDPVFEGFTRYLGETCQLQSVGGFPYLEELKNLPLEASCFETMVVPVLLAIDQRRAALDLSTILADYAVDPNPDRAKFASVFVELGNRLLHAQTTTKEWVTFFSPAELRNYVPPPGRLLIGDSHVVRGAVTVLAGAPGIGKSRAATSLAFAGASGLEWFGLKVHTKFKTAVVQNENGLCRLQREFESLPAGGSDDSIRVCEPPPYGLAFEDADFRRHLGGFFNDFKPDVVVLDPWNSVVGDDKQRDYKLAFDSIAQALPKGGQAPALVIIAHTKKPHGDVRKSGRALLAELAGSHLLMSKPRCVFVLQAATDDPADDRVVWTCCKNNDGAEGARTAWSRRNGLFEPCLEFDWEAFDSPPEKRQTVELADLEALFAGGAKLVRGRAAQKLMEITGLAKTACYSALALDGRFAALLREEDGLLGFAP